MGLWLQSLMDTMQSVLREGGGTISSEDFARVLAPLSTAAQSRKEPCGLWVFPLHHAWLIDWWFRTFFIFQYIGYNHPNWLIFFRGVGQPPCLAYLVSTLFPHDLRSWTPIPRTATVDRGQVEASAAWSAACSFRFPVTGAVNLATAWGNSCETAGICPENGATLGPAGPVGLESQSTQILAHTRRTGSSWLVVWNMAFIFHNIWDYPSHWLIFFKMVKTTNQLGYVWIHSNWDLRRDAVGVFPEMPSNPKCLGGSKESAKEPTLTPCRVDYPLVN